MGNDTPLACLSEQNRPVFDFFYQLFAQVLCLLRADVRTLCEEALLHVPAGFWKAFRSWHVSVCAESKSLQFDDKQGD